jgi:hypothetical protein
MTGMSIDANRPGCRYTNGDLLVMAAASLVTLVWVAFCGFYFVRILAWACDYLGPVQDFALAILHHLPRS